MTDTSRTAAADTIPCLALRPEQAARALNISERKLWQITADPNSGIPHWKHAKTVLYPVRELMDWLGERAGVCGE